MTSPSDERQPIERWVFFSILVAFTILGAILASLGPGPRGYNVIAGEGAKSGTFGPTPANLAAGLAHGVPIGLVLGGFGAGITWIVRRVLRAFRG